VTGIRDSSAAAPSYDRVSVQGLTTAAGLWLVAAIDSPAGAGMYVVSVAATLSACGPGGPGRFEHKTNGWCAADLPCGTDPALGVRAPRRPRRRRVVVAPADYDRRAEENRVH